MKAKKSKKRNSKVSLPEEVQEAKPDMEITLTKSPAKSPKASKRALTIGKEISESPNKIQNEFSNLRVVDPPNLSPAKMDQDEEDSGDDGWVDHDNSSTEDDENPSDESALFSSDEEQILQNVFTGAGDISREIQVNGQSESSSKKKVANKTAEELDAILEKCNLVLKERKEEKKKNQNLHKKKKVRID